MAREGDNENRLEAFGDGLKNLGAAFRFLKGLGQGWAILFGTGALVTFSTAVAAFVGEKGTDIRGYVYDAASHPIEAAQVCVETTALCASTDSLGTFLFAGITDVVSTRSVTISIDHPTHARHRRVLELGHQNLVYVTVTLPDR